MNSAASPALITVQAYFCWNSFIKSSGDSIDYYEVCFVLNLKVFHNDVRASSQRPLAQVRADIGQMIF